jgi:hypothetical protein
MRRSYVAFTSSTGTAWFYLWTSYLSLALPGPRRISPEKPMEEAPNGGPMSTEAPLSARRCLLTHRALGAEASS